MLQYLNKDQRHVTASMEERPGACGNNWLRRILKKQLQKHLTKESKREQNVHTAKFPGQFDPLIKNVWLGSKCLVFSCPTHAIGRKSFG